ncbi:lipoprotein, putative [Fulvivirga imtechensis AK7]|uniref:Lipoprotein, putative n=1 Tax=Fulvivirga imtechensis AK7 TaxID=1237149 RepID=L8JNG0_9BACT|nr:hypothetical protein [Fulvivirga imtechensis]ELR69069.1 lipoprotein, putative [Fulvivirga imtechensis AK7]
MKKYIVVLLLAPVFVACNQKKVDELTAQNQELSTQKQELSTELEAYMKTFNDIENNLKEIKQREEQISVSTGDNVQAPANAKEAIVRDIQAINTLMAENRQKMEELQSKLNTDSKEFKRLVANLNRRLQEKDGELVALKEDLERLNVEREQLTKNVETLTYTVDTLSNAYTSNTETIASQSEKIANQIEALNTAYVAIGTYKDLEGEKVVTKEGGILGIGRTEKLRTDFNDKAFSKIDITKVNDIPVYAKKIELVTTHPEDSYELKRNEEDKVEKLVILDPDKFWNSSKYLVVMVN